MSATEVAIWSRLLQLDFTEHDRTRMHELVVRAQAFGLTEAEEAELDSYCRVGRLLDLMRSKARSAGQSRR